MGSRGKKIVSLVKEQNSEKLQNIKNTEDQAQTKLQVGDIIDVGVCSNILKIVNVENIVEMDSNNEVLNDPDLKCYYLANNNDAGLLEIDNHNLLNDQLLFDKNGTVTDESTELPKINLVDYDSSSSNNDFDMSTKPKAQAKSNQRKLRRRSSEMSFNEGKEKISSDSEEYWSDLEKQVVGKPVKKKSKLGKRKSRMIEKSYGKGKALQPNPCKTNCPNQCTLKFPEVVRQDIHEFYWGLGNSQRQRDWLLSCIKQVGIKRRRQEAETSRRHTTFKYVIPWNDVEHRVCQKFLLKTLDISQMTLRYTKSNAVSCRISKTDQRGRHEPANKTSSELRQNVVNFIMKLPAVPSHYCRAKTSRKYLPSEFRNLAFLYRIFVKDQINIGNNSHVSFKVFRGIFQNEFNIGFHLPKKDKCVICEPRKDKDFKETENSAHAYKKHLGLKDICKEEFLKNQKKGLKEENFLCVSFDLQKVLSTPHGDNLLLYYARKYSFYNLTVYENVTQNALCYLWGECDGNRGSNEICTTLYKYLHGVDKKGTTEHVSFHCDSCSGQNKNRSTLAMLFYFLAESSKIKTIKITFLLPGHTYMPVDSIHGTIERFIKNRIIWAPSEWETIIGNARTNPRNLETVKLCFTDFLDWKQLSNEVLQPKKFKSVEGESIKITQVRSVYIEKNNPNVVIDYSYDGSDIKIMKIALPKKVNLKSKRLYSNKLCVTPIKKKNLEDLCKKNVIPRKYHQEYFNMNTSDKISDVLPETDQEDEVEELEDQ